MTSSGGTGGRGICEGSILDCVVEDTRRLRNGETAGACDNSSPLYLLLFKLEDKSLVGFGEWEEVGVDKRFEEWGD